ncbi:MAG: hypothetical protein Kow0098_09010 [Ignavibacteriaceae bacterium]
MSYTIKKVDYFYCSVEDQPGEAYKLLSTLRNMGVNLLAFTAIPVGPMRTQLTLFPEDSSKLISAVQKAGLVLDGPQRALLVNGDDELGALTEIHEKLYQANVNIYASNGVTDGKGSYGYVIYVRPEEYERAVSSLEL